MAIFCFDLYAFDRFYMRLPRRKRLAMTGNGIGARFAIHHSLFTETQTARYSMDPRSSSGILVFLFQFVEVFTEGGEAVLHEPMQLGQVRLL